MLSIANLENINAANQSDQKETVTLDECYNLAIKNSTISKKDNTNRVINANNTKDAYSVYIPNIALNSVASYQSDVVSISLPNMKEPRKENYSVTLDLNQPIYNGGIASKKSELAKSNLEASTLKLDIEKLALRDQVSSLFLGISLLKSVEDILDLNIDILDRNIKKMKNLFDNGVGQKSDYLQLESEMIKAKQSLANNKADQTKIVNMLSILIGEKLSLDYKYIIPYRDFTTSFTSHRPEYELYNVQNKILDENIKLVDVNNLPKLSLFASGGNGLPGYNMLNRSPDWFYKVGIKFSIPITSWKTTKYKKQALTLQKRLITTQKDDYTKQNNIYIAQTEGEITKYQNTIEYDKVIVSKKKEIATIEESKLQKGIITSSEYITELNQYKEAMLAQKLNEIKLVQAIINYKSAIGQEN